MQTIWFTTKTDLHIHLWPRRDFYYIFGWYKTAPLNSAVAHSSIVTSIDTHAELNTGQAHFLWEVGLIEM